MLYTFTLFSVTSNQKNVGEKAIFQKIILSAEEEERSWTRCFGVEMHILYRCIHRIYLFYKKDSVMFLNLIDSKKLQLKIGLHSLYCMDQLAKHPASSIYINIYICLYHIQQNSRMIYKTKCKRRRKGNFSMLVPYSLNTKFPNFLYFMLLLKSEMKIRLYMRPIFH